jgi:hypothetical protein
MPIFVIQLQYLKEKNRVITLGGEKVLKIIFMAQKQRMIIKYGEFLSSVCFFSMVQAKICDPEVQSSSYL